MRRINHHSLFLFFILIISCSKTPGKEVYGKYLEALELYQRSEFKESLKMFKEVYSEYPDFTENSRMYAFCLYHRGYEEKAVLIWETLDLEENPDIDIMKVLITYYLDHQQLNKAVILLDKGIKVSSEDPLLLFLKARVCISKGEMTQALSLLLSCLTLMEKQIVIPLELARVYSSFGFESEAADLMKRYSLYLPEDHPLQKAVQRITSSRPEESE